MIKPNTDGLKLTGLLVASDINQGLRKDDGTPWARRTAMISTGRTCITFSESIDFKEIDKALPYETGTRVEVDVTYTNTNSGNISVGGDLSLLETKETK
jgi:hypothetical protein